MSKGELVALIASLTTIGTTIIGALMRTLFLGLKSRIDKVEREVKEDFRRCMEEIVKLAKDIK